MMKKVKIPVPASVFRWGVFFLVGKVLFSSSRIIPYGELVDVILEMLSAGCLALSIISKRLSMRTLMVYAFFAVCGIVTAISTGSMFVFLTILTCLSIRGENLEKTIRFVFFYELLIVFLHIVISVLAYLVGYVEFMIVKGDPRFYFGFNHPNSFSIFLLNISVMWVWLNYDKLTLKTLLLLLCMHVPFSIFTECRTSLIAMVILLVCFLVFYNKTRRERLLTTASAVCVPVLALMVYVLMSQYHTGEAWVKAIDKLLASRIKLGAYALENYGLSLIGQNMLNVQVVWDEYWRLNAHTFDNIYSYILINYGVIWLVVLTFVFAEIAKTGEERDKIMILLWAAYGMTEVHPLNPFNFFPLMLIARVYKRGFGRNKILKSKGSYE